jgi:fatty-acyl-CoA synthase
VTEQSRESGILSGRVADSVRAAGAVPSGEWLPHSGPTVGAVTLRALRRHPDRTAFSWDGGTLSYAGATDLIGRIQRVYAERGLRGLRP